ncbi:hypothetical protein LMG29739_04037 [Paraburkholderia solisilvae]|uniref:Uncharacterized protein n=1 Tax=Paraburkholderia solisilvae TaxID=624376 RepID=A0A6J5E9T3_9BURK|nr:hypothetical protein LMG29739_04037 [Paraburkholderia solisilvae]
MHATHARVAFACVPEDLKDEFGYFYEILIFYFTNEIMSNVEATIMDISYRHVE